MDKLLKVQAELKAEKSQWNKFGKYYYRSCDDILEAVKPLLKKYGLLMTISDRIVNVGNYNYILSEIRILDTESKESELVTGYAREAEKQSGMADAQITGSTSSYARKYALNGMFLIDDTKDADSHDNRPESEPAKPFNRLHAIEEIEKAMDAMNYPDIERAVVQGMVHEAKTKGEFADIYKRIMKG